MELVAPGVGALDYPVYLYGVELPDLAAEAAPAVLTSGTWFVFLGGECGLNAGASVFHDLLWEWDLWRKCFANLAVFVFPVAVCNRS